MFPAHMSNRSDANPYGLSKANVLNFRTYPIAEPTVTQRVAWQMESWTPHVAATAAVGIMLRKIRSIYTRPHFLGAIHHTIAYVVLLPRNLLFVLTD
jgi:hypothetical protein